MFQTFFLQKSYFISLQRFKECINISTMKWATFQVTVFILSIHSMLSTCDQGIEAADIEELKSVIYPIPVFKRELKLLALLHLCISLVVPRFSQILISSGASEDFERSEKKRSSMMSEFFVLFKSYILQENYEANFH